MQLLLPKPGAMFSLGGKVLPVLGNKKSPKEFARSHAAGAGGRSGHPLPSDTAEGPARCLCTNPRLRVRWVDEIDSHSQGSSVTVKLVNYTGPQNLGKQYNPGGTEIINLLINYTLLFLICK